MSVIKWELLKVFKQKSLYIIGIFLFGWFTFIAFDVENTDVAQQVYQKWEGPITAEKIAEAKKVTAEINADIAAEKVLDERESVEYSVVENIALSQTFASQKKERAADLEKLISEEKSKGDTALANKLELQKEMFNDVELDKISYYAGPREAVDFVNVFGLILTGLFLLIGLSGIYSNEASSGVENYILSTKNGRVITMRAKLLASFIFTKVVVVVWEAFNLIIKTAIYGTKGWDLPIQYSFKYFASPYSLTFTEYHLIQLGLHLLAALAFAGVIVVISTISKSTVISFFVSGFLFGIPLLASNIMNNGTLWLNKVMKLTLTNMMKVEDLYMNFISVNLFGFPVLAPYVGITVAVTILIMAIFMARLLITKKQIA